MKEVPTLMRLKFCLLLALACAGCGAASKASQTARAVAAQSQSQGAAQRPSSGSPFLDKLVEAAIERTSHEVRYDQSYFTIAYPGVDVPSDADESRMQIVHNIGAGPKMEDVLFNWKITGHYRYTGPKEEKAKRPRARD